MDSITIGNRLNRVCYHAKTELFAQGELAQLSAIAFNLLAKNVHDGAVEEIVFPIPVGYTQFRTPMLGKRAFKREELSARYAHLARHQVSINGIYQLAIIVEAMLGDLLRLILLQYPKKIGSKKTINIGDVLAATSIEELHSRAADKVLNELGYKSPKDFAASMEDLLSINLLECVAFHKYVEMKATRDVHVHNKGIANEVYLLKSNSHARAKPGNPLPVDDAYFLESYEACLQLVEWLGEKLNEKWLSTELEERRAQTQIPEELSAEPQSTADSETRR